MGTESGFKRWRWEATASVKRSRLWALAIGLYFGEPWGYQGPLWGVVVKVGPLLLMAGVRDYAEDLCFEDGADVA